MTSTRGVVHPDRLPSFVRLPPPPGAAHLLRWTWVPRWDLPAGVVSRQDVVGFPAANLVVQSDGAVGLAGATTRASHRDLAGRGWAVGALLRPAAAGTLRDDLPDLLDRWLPLDLPALRDAVTAAMTGPGGGPERAAAALAQGVADLVGGVGEVAAAGLVANDVEELLSFDPAVTSLAQAAARLGTSTRTLQRLTSRWIGLPPTALLRRRRVQEAVERLRDEPSTDLAALAADLGYVDQAHLTHDVRTVLGTTPAAFRRASTTA